MMHRFLRNTVISSKCDDIHKIIIIAACLISFFTYTALFDGHFSIKLGIWLVLGVCSTLGLFTQRTVPMTMFNYMILRLFFVVFILLGGLANGHMHEALASFVVLYSIFITFCYLSLSTGWINVFIHCVCCISTIYVFFSIIPIFIPQFVSLFSKLLLTNESYRYNLSMVSWGYYIGIATQSSYQCHYILPILSYSFCKLTATRHHNGKWLFLFFLSVFSLILQKKRMPLIAVVVMIFFLLFLMSKNQKGKGRTTLLFLVLTFFIIVLLKTRYGNVLIERFSFDYLLHNKRIDMWSVALDIFAKKPILGGGIAILTDYLDLSAHNSFIQVLVESGIIGLLCYLLITIVPFIYSIKSFSRIRKQLFNSNDCLVFIMCSIFVQGFCIIHSFSESVFSSEVLFLPFQIYSAICYSINYEINHSFDIQV